MERLGDMAGESGRYSPRGACWRGQRWSLLCPSGAGTLAKVLTLSEPRFLICEAGLRTRDENGTGGLDVHLGHWLGSGTVGVPSSVCADSGMAGTWVTFAARLVASSGPRPRLWPGHRPASLRLVRTPFWQSGGLAVWSPREPRFACPALGECWASSACPHTRQGELRISVLPAYLSYDAPWPVRKIPLRCTAHYVAYHVESKVRPRSLWAGAPLGTAPQAP